MNRLRARPKRALNWSTAAPEPTTPAVVRGTPIRARRRMSSGRRAAVLAEMPMLPDFPSIPMPVIQPPEQFDEARVQVDEARSPPRTRPRLVPPPLPPRDVASVPLRDAASVPVACAPATEQEARIMYADGEQVLQRVQACLRKIEQDFPQVSRAVTQQARVVMEPEPMFTQPPPPPALPVGIARVPAELRMPSPRTLPAMPLGSGRPTGDMLRFGATRLRPWQERQVAEKQQTDMERMQSAMLNAMASRRTHFLPEAMEESDSDDDF